MRKRTWLASALLLATALDANAADPATAREAEFTVTEYVRGGDSVIGIKHYRPVSGSPVDVLLEDWQCEAFAADSPRTAASWVCSPNDSNATAMIKCRAGSVNRMTIAGGTPPKAYELTIDWTVPKPAGQDAGR